MLVVPIPWHGWAAVHAGQDQEKDGRQNGQDHEADQGSLSKFQKELDVIAESWLDASFCAYYSNLTKKNGFTNYLRSSWGPYQWLDKSDCFANQVIDGIAMSFVFVLIAAVGTFCNLTSRLFETFLMRNGRVFK